jgi:hypothetical protein
VAKSRRTDLDSYSSRLPRPTLRGLTTGIVKVQTTDNREPVVLWGEAFCSWIGVLGILNLKPVGIFLTCLDSIELVRKCVGADCFVGRVDSMDTLVSQSLIHGARLGLIDGRVTSAICGVASTLGLTRLLGTTSMRRKISGWSHDSWRVTHCDVGGVTTLGSHGCCLVPGNEAPSTSPLPYNAPRDASTVLCPMAQATKYRPIPDARVLFPLRCENLGTATRPYYHGGGLLPGNLDRRTEVLTSGCFAPKHHWALRPLTFEEVLVAKDFGKVLAQLLSFGKLSNAFIQSLTPGKSLVAFASRWGCNGGGAFFKKARSITSISGLSISGLEERDLKKQRCGELNESLGEKKNGIQENFNGKSQKFIPEVTKEGDTTRKGISSGSRIDELNHDEALQGISREQRDRKAVKSDDAGVPEYLWEDELLDGLESVDWDAAKLKKVRRVSTWLRTMMLRWWKRSVTTSYIQWAKEKYELTDVEIPVTWIEWKDSHYVWKADGKGNYRAWWKRRILITHQDAIPAGDASWRAAKTSWWGWDEGSRPFHWRWPKFYQEVIRDGLKVHFQERPPEYKKPQRDIPDDAMKLKVIKKLMKARDRRYIAPGLVKSLTAFFAVAKGEDDIWLVYDGSVSGLNLSIWVPRFFLPTLRTHLRAVDVNTYMADVDIGEMFLNFILHKELRALAGVDLTHYFPEDAEDKDGRQQKVFETWQRAAMGLRSSPYQAVQAMGVAEEFIRGDRMDPTNIFRWDEVVLNLPGSDDYDASKPWVYKVRSNDGRIAADLFIFVDDLRPTGPSKREAWLAARQAASRLNFLGIQDAPRKRRGSSRTPGAWAGAVVITTDDGVFVLTSQEKWDKAKAQLEEVRLMLEADPTKLPRKRLEQIRGFLQYVTQTYTSLTCYLIGFHMTIDSWRPGRDHEGWRLAQNMWERIKKEDEDWSREEVVTEEVPITVEAVPRFRADITALATLMTAEKPPLKRARCNQTCKVFYGFGDASGCGFGATIQIGDEIHFEYGQWCSEVTEEKSSNWRELNNLVEALERVVLEHDMRGSEIFIFTDNSVAEAAFWKGSSKSQALFELVLRLKRLELAHDITLHVIHVSGRRMIAEGADDLSRAYHGVGVMLGKDIRFFIPLHLDPVVREPQLTSWLGDVTRDMGFKTLTPSGWFDDAHKDGNFIWTVPPAAAEVVVEQLGFIRLKRPNTMHIIVVPRLMTGRWRKHLSRGTDGYAKLEDKEVWDLSKHYEPVLIFLCLPFVSSNPKLQERGRLLDRFRRTVLEQQLPQVSSLRRRDILRQLLCDARKLCPV